MDARLLPRGSSLRAVAMNTLSGALNKAKAWGDEKLPQMKEKMKEIGEKTQKMIVPPSGSAGNAKTSWKCGQSSPLDAAAKKCVCSSQ